MVKRKKFILVVIIIVLLCMCGGIVYISFHKNVCNEICGGVVGFVKKSNLIDDWKYENKEGIYDETKLYSSSSSTNQMEFATSDITSSISSGTSNNNIGLSTGGAKNIENFRENIKNGYFPISTDITYNGLFYDYYFNTGAQEQSTEIFSPSYSVATSKDPISNEMEYYMTVGLNSNIKESDFQRKKLNVVILLDISGSMESSFKSYYYGSQNEDKEYKSKMKIANESVNVLIDELNEDDRLGIVLFESSSHIAKPINLVGETDIEKIKEHVLDIKSQCGTNFEAGYNDATGLFSEKLLNDSEYENRIIVITDAMPNMGITSKDGLAEKVSRNADNGIYTTFIGVGVDFNTQVIECLSDVKGANYYSVHNSEEFKKIMGEDFDYMVTPLVFDLELKLESQGFSIESVYGTDTKNKQDGTIMKVNTLFPSSSNDNGENKGGVILLKLKSNFTCGTNLEEEMKNEKIKLLVSYKDRNGKQYSNYKDIQFKNVSEEYYDNTGIRKSILLTRYANLMKNWILYERSEDDEQFLITTYKGIEDCDYTVDEVYRLLGENERKSVKLTVSEEYKELFKKMKKYMENEINEIGDDELKQEIEILQELI